MLCQINNPFFIEVALMPGVVDPPLTTLNKAADKVGKLAAELLYNKLQSNNAEYKNMRELIIKQELCIRKSCGCNK